MNTPQGVELAQVAFSYPGTSLRFDIRFPRNAVTALMGPSGSGKTTLLHLVAGFESPDAGRILIGGRDVTEQPPDQRPVTMVFQENNLFAHLSVEQNIGLGRDPGLRLSPADRAAVAGALDSVGLTGKEKRRPRELSGGERQRVALARAILRDRPVLLLDEPFAALGPALRTEMLELIRSIREKRSLTVLLVTHQPEDAERIADEIAFLEDGRLSAQGKAADFFGSVGPAAFRHYIGTTPEKVRSTDSLPKPT